MSNSAATPRALTKREAQGVAREISARLPEHAAEVRDLLTRDMDRARQRLRALTGTIRLVEPKGEDVLRAEYDLGVDTLILQAKSLKDQVLNVVAGAGFEPATFGL